MSPTVADLVLPKLKLTQVNRENIGNNYVSKRNLGPIREVPYQHFFLKIN